MNKWFFFCLMVANCVALRAQNQQQAYLDYVENYKYVAIEEMKRGGIPASIKLAQALLESNAGRSKLSQGSNNHFGIKCGKNWEGPYAQFKDDDYKNGQLVESCFRAYNDVVESFADHTEFLRNKNKYSRYGFLFTLDPLDYKAWAYGLKDAGYATDMNYPTNLIAIIERYELYKYDYEGNVPPPPVYIGSIKSPGFIYNNQDLQHTDEQNVFIQNDAKLYVPVNVTTPAEIAHYLGLEVEDLLEYNEGLKDAHQKIHPGDRVYLQSKRNFNHGKELWHYVRQGETMYYISQLYGIKLDKLYHKNRMEKGTEPAIGEKIKLRWRIGKDEIPRLASDIKSILPDKPLESTPDTEVSQAITPMAEPITRPKAQTPVPINTEAIKAPAPKPKPAPTPVPKPATKTIPAAQSIPPKSESIPPRTESIPPKTESIPPPVEAVKPPVDSNQDGHEVSPGDTVYNLSKKYGIKPDQIREWNALSSDSIKIGQKLIIKKNK